MKRLSLENLLEEVYLCEGSSWKARDLKMINESNQKDLSNRTITSLFKSIKAKAFNLDFSDVEIARGDITKINSYKDLLEAIKFLKKISTNVNNVEVNNAIAQLEMAHMYLLANKKGFTMAFNVGNNLVMYLFNSVSVALVQATSFVISNCIDIVKDNMNIYSCEVKHVTKLPKNNNLSALARFNEMGKSGKLNTMINNTLKLKEDPLMITLSITASVLLGLYLIREIIFSYYYMRISLSQYLKHLQEFVLMNASTLSSDQKKIKEKQEKIAKKLGELSDKIAIDQNMATERSKQDISLDNKNTANTNTPSNSGELADILY